MKLLAVNTSAITAEGLTACPGLTNGLILSKHYQTKARFYQVFLHLNIKAVCQAKWPMVKREVFQFTHSLSKA